MIVLPTTHGLRAGQPREVDPGLHHRAPGGALTRISRPGLKFACEFTLPPMSFETARPFIARLLRAKAEGIRVPFPVADQGAPGTPVVNGSGAAGTSLPVRGATPGFSVGEGYWLNVIDSDGVHSLHTVAAAAVLTSGSGTLSVWPPLRATFVDGNLIELAEPKFEGLVTSEISWPLPHTQITQLSFEVEESS